jgi:hypothetical protein
MSATFAESKTRRPDPPPAAPLWHVPLVLELTDGTVLEAEHTVEAPSITPAIERAITEATSAFEGELGHVQEVRAKRLPVVIR